MLRTETWKRWKQIPPEGDLVEISFCRSVTGLTVMAQAPMFEDFMKSLLKLDRVDAIVGSALGVKIYNVKFPDVGGAFWNPKNASLVNEEGAINITYLSSVGLSSGVEFKVNGLFSNPTIESLRRSTQQVILQLTNDYLRPLEVGMVLNWERKWDGSS